MTPILGITASSITSSTLGSYESIQTVSVTTATQANIEFTNIPGTYKHLQIRATLFGTNLNQNLRMQFNSDTTANYALHQLYGDGATAGTGGGTGEASIYGAIVPNSTTTAAVNITDILDYTNTNKNTVVRSLGGYDSNGSGFVILRSGVWLNTAAITSIKFFISAANFQQYTHFALYGIKG